jgi:pimeloyl-ACP methyl ester carboxylesterase
MATCACMFTVRTCDARRGWNPAMESGWQPGRQSLRGNTQCAMARGCVALALLAICSGCLSYGRRSLQVLSPPLLDAQPGDEIVVAHRETIVLTSEASIGSPLAVAAELAEQADSAEKDGEEECVELYFRAVCASLRAAERVGTLPSGQLHGRALHGLLRTSQRFGRYDPLNGIAVRGANGQSFRVRIDFHGFDWSPSDFDELRSADDYQDHDLHNHYIAPGWGASLVVVRRAQRESAFLRPDHPFAATAVLTGNDAGEEARLSLYNPFVYDRVAVGDDLVPLHRDLSAPLGYVSQIEGRPWLTGFLEPTSADVAPKLLMLEPPSAGKIPLVFVHGLLSDPMAWADLVNELRADPGLNERYQIWAFRYPTGDAVLSSAASLRELLVLARDTADLSHKDPAYDQVVIVGHSMGGLVAKMQIAESYDLLWNRFATQPLDAVQAPPEMLERLKRGFFFRPSPSVTRVVFIGTPHRGSAWSRRVVGRVGADLVRLGAGRNEPFSDFVNANRDIVRPRFHSGPPTSLDMLEPDSPFLEALLEMPVSRRVRLHSIIGDARAGVIREPSDGVVPVSSARLKGVESEVFVNAEHTMLHRDPATTEELKRILCEHVESARQPLKGASRP